MEYKLDIPLHGSSLNIVRQCRLELSDILDIKFGCIATINGVDFESDLDAARQRRPTIRPEKRLSVSVSGVQVSVWKADLTNFSADAVVNAANSDLHHCGGLAQALCDAGGPQIQRESNDYIRRNGKVPTGDAITAQPGFLPCKMIIHAVGPHLSSHSDVRHAEPQLQRVIWKILDIVCHHRLRNVAIPAISSGLFNYPLRQCAETIVSAVKHHCERARGQLPKEIFLVNNDEPTVMEIERACHKILMHHQPMSYSQATAHNTRGAAKMPASTFQVGSVLLTLKSGHIEEQQTDVIVNTASPDRDLSAGQISKALLNKAGPEMQMEISSAPHTVHPIITNAYRLNCREVYHTFCIEKGKYAAEKILYDSVLQCLQTAVTRKHKSITFPAIGTGGLSFTKTEAARIMSDAVYAFAQNVPEKFEVYIVIYPDDHNTLQAFEERMSSLQKRASNPSSLHASEDRRDFHVKRDQPAQISLSSLSNEASHEAEKWLSGLLLRSADTVVIYNNFILHFSEEDQRQVSRLSRKGVSIEEFFTKGHACINVSEAPHEDIVVTALQIEAMLCNIHKRFVSEEEKELCVMTNTKEVSCERPKVLPASKEFGDRSSAFRRQGLEISKMDEVVNPTLNQLFSLKKKQLKCATTEKMFQRIPAQFCEMVSRIGFYAEYAPPDEPNYGEGIYFAGTVRKAMEVWKEKREEYLYFVEAEVLKGKSTLGKPGLILPPAVGNKPGVLYDSVNGGPDVTVIFSGYQALPRYIITCKRLK